MVKLKLTMLNVVCDTRKASILQHGMQMVGKPM